MIRRGRFPIAAALAALLTNAPELAHAGESAHGEVIAKRWCVNCHVVAPDQTTARSEAPPFDVVARNWRDDKALANFLADPHPKMPNWGLSRKEIDDLVAYIRSLDSNPPPPAQQPGEKDDGPPKKG